MFLMQEERQHQARPTVQSPELIRFWRRRGFRVLSASCFTASNTAETVLTKYSSQPVRSTSARPM